jgi:hypothetical protein
MTTELNNDIPVPGTISYLAIKNKHERDKHISFEEGPHIYTVCGDRGGFTSVTTWNHKHFSPFNSDDIIHKIVNGKRWNTDPNYKYYKMTREAIKLSWDTKRDSASSAGTSMHNDIELFYNGVNVRNDSVEFKYFKNFIKDFPDLKPYRTEWMVYYEEIKLSGSIDMIYENPDGTLLIYDWKRCQEISFESSFSNFATTPCISHLPDTNFWHYALQLNMYKTILEHKYGKKVVGLFLVCMHPDNKYNNYQCIQVPDLITEMEDLILLRLQQVANL